MTRAAARRRRAERRRPPSVYLDVCGCRMGSVARSGRATRSTWTDRLRYAAATCRRGAAPCCSTGRAGPRLSGWLSRLSRVEY